MHGAKDDREETWAWENKRRDDKGKWNEEAEESDDTMLCESLISDKAALENKARENKGEWNEEEEESDDTVVFENFKDDANKSK